MASGVLEPRGKATRKALPPLNPPTGSLYADYHLICVRAGNPSSYTQIATQSVYGGDGKHSDTQIAT